MPKLSFTRPVAGVVVAVAAVAAAAVLASPTLAPATAGRVRVWVNSRPVADLPEQIDLGAVPPDSPTVAAFALTNRGYGPLVIDQIRIGCACGGLFGLEVKTADGYRLVDRLEVAPGESADLALRFHVGGAGQPVRAAVRFHTTDPARPEAEVVATGRTAGGLTADPPQVLVGEVPAGQPHRERVAVHDAGDTPRTVRQVAAVGFPADCRFVPAAGPNGLLGHVELTVTPAAGRLAGHLEVTTDPPTPRPLVVPVSGSAVPPVRLSPAAVRLPLHSDAGPVFEVTCLCRVRAGGPTDLRVAVAPPALEVRLGPGGDGPGRLTVAVREGHRRPAAAETHTVVLEAGPAGQAVRVELPVTVTP